MPLTPEQIAAIQNAFNADAHARTALLLAQPNGGGLYLLADVLKEVLNADGRNEAQIAALIEQLSVFYSFDASRNPPSRSGATLANQPVRGVLVSADNQLDLAALNANPIVIGGLCFPEVFPERLAEVRQQWVSLAGGSADASAAADAHGLSVPLNAFLVRGEPDTGCGGSSCPGTTTVTRR